MFSSPSTAMARDESLIIISSSPEFPSICDLIPLKTAKNPTTLRGGKKAVPGPDDALTTPTSASKMRRGARPVEDEDTLLLEADTSRPALKDGAPIKPTPKPRETTKPSKKKSVQPAEAAGNSVELVEFSENNVAGPKRRGKQVKPLEETIQTTIVKGKVTKPVAKEKVTRKKVGTVSRHFANSAATSRREIAAPIDENESVVLEPAMARRLDWTPPRGLQFPGRPGGSSNALDADPIEETSAYAENSPEDNIFKAFYDKFGRKSDDIRSVSSGSGASSVDILGKRKLIEMVHTTAIGIGNINADSESPADCPVKLKAVKKKPRTITELATAAYRQQKEPPNQESLLSYLDTSDTQTGSSSTAVGGKGKAGKRPAKPKVSKKKPQPNRPILLSPESALRQVAQQDFVFGTSSQLATEDDPELLRALHKAMKLSNNAADDPFDSSSPGTSGLAVRKKPGRLLWAASARDEDGELLDMEILDLTESPPLPHVQHPTKVVESLDDSVQILEQPLPPSPTKEPRAIKETSPPSPGAEVQRDVGNSIFDLTDSSADTKLKFPPAPRSAITKALVEEIPEPNDTNWDDDLDFELPPSNQEHHELLLTQSSSPQVSFSVATSNQKLTWPSNIPSDKAPALPSSLSPPTKSMAPPRPKYELFTDAQLARDVAKFGFKPVKKRSAMLALLDQCWASRGQPAVGDVAMNAHMMSTTSATPTHSKLTTTAAPLGPAGRPRKSSGTAAASVDYGSLKVPDLKKLLQERSLKQSGNKPDLIARLQDYDLQRRTSAGGPSSPRGKPRKDAPSSPKKTKSPTRRAASPRLAGSPASTPRNKKSQGRTATIEIPDSDADSDLDDPMLSSPISPARRARPRDDEDIFSSPPRVDLSITEDAEMSLIASPTTEQVSVFAYITKAIKSAPPSRDPMDPSWHEKILMYDPIILEDLASWLNAGQLDKAGFDGEVSPADVKQWCESKGVCCLWRVSLRGLERKRL